MLEEVKNKKEKNMEKIKEELEKAGFDFAVAVATQAEIDAKAACGMLSMIVEEDKKIG